MDEVRRKIESFQCSDTEDRIWNHLDLVLLKIDLLHSSLVSNFGINLFDDIVAEIYPYKVVSIPPVLFCHSIVCKVAEAFRES